MLTVLSGIDEFEADMVKERQLEGVELAMQEVHISSQKYTDKHKVLHHDLELLNNRNLMY